MCGYCAVIVRLLCGASGEAIMGRRKAPKGERGEGENGKQIIQKHNKDAKDCVLVDILAFSLELIIF